MWPLSGPNKGLYLFEKRGETGKTELSSSKVISGWWPTSPDPGNTHLPLTVGGAAGWRGAPQAWPGVPLPRFAIPIALHVSAGKSTGDSLLLRIQTARSFGGGGQPLGQREGGPGIPFPLLLLRVCGYLHLSIHTGLFG